jgi:hypothetical protein
VRLKQRRVLGHSSQTVHTNRPGARTALSARIEPKELADKAVRAPRFQSRSSAKRPPAPPSQPVSSQHTRIQDSSVPILARFAILGAPKRHVARESPFLAAHNPASSANRSFPGTELSASRPNGVFWTPKNAVRGGTAFSWHRIFRFSAAPTFSRHGTFRFSADSPFSAAKNRDSRPDRVFGTPGNAVFRRNPLTGNHFPARAPFQDTASKNVHSTGHHKAPS